jgi:hypothetical protein
MKAEKREKVKDEKERYGKKEKRLKESNRE